MMENLFMKTALRRLLPFIIVTIFCVAAVELFYHIAEGLLSSSAGRKTATVAGKSAAAPPPSVTSDDAPFDYSVITKRNLFQSYEKVPEVEKKDATATSEEIILDVTKLNLLLLGTVADDANGGIAIIQSRKSSKQQLCYTGDVIEGAQIKKIERSRVILTIGGKDEILEMVTERQDSGSDTSVGAVSPRVQSPKVVKETEGAEENGTADFPPPTADEQVLEAEQQGMADEDTLQEEEIQPHGDLPDFPPPDFPSKKKK